MTAAVVRPYAVPRSGGNGRAIVLAVLMHALLAAVLFFGVRWQSSEPAVIQAELWSAIPQTAAPKPTEVPPPPKVEAPRPEPKAEEPPPVVKPDIVEKVPVKVEPPKKKQPPKVEPPKPVPKAEPVKAAPRPPVEATPRPPSDLANILASAGTPSTGKDAQTSGPRGRDSYIGRLQNAIRSQMRYPANSPGNPVVTVRIEQLPNGEVVTVTVTKASGVPSFDDAVERAVRAASPLPRDELGKVERVLDVDYKMYDRP
jgi:colicin import membrane protein